MGEQQSPEGLLDRLAPASVNLTSPIVGACTEQIYPETGWCTSHRTRAGDTVGGQVMQPMDKWSHAPGRPQTGQRSMPC